VAIVALLAAFYAEYFQVVFYAFLKTKKPGIYPAFLSYR